MKKSLLYAFLWERFPKRPGICFRHPIFLLFLVWISFPASVQAQDEGYTVIVENQKVADVLKDIEASSDYRFFYIREQVDVQRIVSLNIENASIGDVLEEIFADQQIIYEITGDNLIILIPEVNPAVQDPGGSENEITGAVTDSDGFPLLAVTVFVKGTTKGTVTDADGRFVLSEVGSEDVLVFSMVGMQDIEVQVGMQTTVNIQMEEDVVGLEEVVVIGYGTTKKTDLTGAVATVTSDEVEKISTTSTAQALQGRMAGVQITRTSGEPGSGSTIKIRGIGSLRSDNSPLVMIDGYQGSIDDVLPEDIESVSVLKDASAASIYGARAANGVILVTTKRGMEGKTQIDMSAEIGISQLTKKPPFLNAEEYATKMNETNAWNGRPPIWVDEYAPENLGVGTDWWDYVYKQGRLDKYHLGMRGGNESSRYALSLGYLKEEGLIDNTGYDRITTRFNFDHKFNKWLSVGANYSLSWNKSYDHNENIWGDGIGYNGYGLGVAAHRTSPTVPAYFEDGSLGIYVLDKPGERPGNGTLPPTWYYGNKEEISKSMNNRVSIFGEISLLKGLKYKSVFNVYQWSNYYTHWHGTWVAYYPDSDIAAQENTRNGLNSLARSSFGWEIQQLLSYDRIFGAHHVTALLGFSAEKNQAERMDHLMQGFLSNELHVADAGSEIMNAGGTKSIVAYESLFGRFNYGYGNKYLLQATVRRDGSSAFAPGHQYGVFPSISGAWKISSEPFLESIDFLTNLKVRAGYGQLGNAKIPSFKWLSSFNLTDGHPFGGGFPQVFQPAYYVNSIPNEEVKWETTTTLNIGVDAGFLRNRLTLELDFYNKRTTDLLWPATVPETAGFIEGPMVNIGEVMNRGWELTMGWQERKGSLSYGLSANLSQNENMVVDMGGIPEQLNGNIMVKEGYPINSYWGYKLHENRLWMTWEELENNVKRSGDIRPGDYRYQNLGGADADGNPSDEPDDVINSYDMVYLGDAIPDFYYGFSGFLEYRGIDFNFLFVGEIGKQAMVGPAYGGAYSGGNVLRYYHENRAILDENGEVISGSVNAAGADAGGGSEATIHDISYLRVKNLQLGYTFPSAWMQKIKVSSIRIYVNATNPFIFTDYVGWDQESRDLTAGHVSGGGNQYVPVSRIFSVGLSVKL